MTKFLHSGNALMIAVWISGVTNAIALTVDLVQHQWLKAGAQSFFLLLVAASYWLSHWFRAYGQLLYDNALLSKRTAEGMLKMQTDLESAMSIETSDRKTH